MVNSSSLRGYFPDRTSILFFYSHSLGALHSFTFVLFSGAACLLKPSPNSLLFIFFFFYFFSVAEIVSATASLLSCLRCWRLSQGVSLLQRLSLIQVSFLSDRQLVGLESLPAYVDDSDAQSGRVQIYPPSIDNNSASAGQIPENSTFIIARLSIPKCFSLTCSLLSACWLSLSL